MADRESAEIFGTIFREIDTVMRDGLTDRLTAQAVLTVLAVRIGAISEQYDFTVDQMEIDIEILNRLSVQRSF